MICCALYFTVLGGLDPKITEADLYSAFIPFGEIVATRLPKNNLSKHAIISCNGYLKFISRKASGLRIC